MEAIVEALAKRANLGSKNLLPLIKLLSTAEMKARRGNGLCFTCDERISLEHKCEHNKLYVIMTQSLFAGQVLKMLKSICKREAAHSGDTNRENFLWIRSGIGIGSK